MTYRRYLYIAADPVLADPITELLAGKGDLQTVHDIADEQSAIDEGAFSGILLHHQRDTDRTLDTLTELSKNRSRTPILIILPTDEQSFGLECLGKGADDFILQEHLSRLPHSLLMCEQIRHRQPDPEYRFRKIYEYADIGICMVAADARILGANATLAWMLGYSIDKLKQLSLHRLMKENITELPELKLRLEDGGLKRVLLEREYAHQDGHSVWVRVSSSPLPVEDDGEQYFLLQIQDATEFMNLKREHESAMEKARKSEEVKNQFLATVSREIRTPLTPILGFYDVISKEIEPVKTDKMDQYLQIIRMNCNRLTRTVEEIVNMSELQAGTLMLNREIIDLAVVLNKVYHEHRTAAESEGLKLVLDNRVLEAKVQVDRQSVHYALSNLVDNAIKYTHDGRIELILDQIDNSYSLEIKDTGIGVAEENLDRILEAFTQESHGETRLYGGLGLGLTLTKRYLDLNEVQMEFHSEKAVGTTVTLTFARREKAVLKPASVDDVLAETTIKPGGEHPTILIVEDDLHAQLLTELHLKNYYNTCFAVSVAEARHQLETADIDLILLDISLEDDENGLDLAALVRKTDQWMNLPIIALTAHAFAADRTNAMKAGCDDFMTKPIVKKQLLRKIEQALEPA